MRSTRTTRRTAATVAASASIALGVVAVGAPAASAQSTTKKPTPVLWSPPTTSATPQFSGTASDGATGDAVKAVEQRLDALHYFTGTVDSTFDDETAHAVTAFQKVNNLPRTGKVDATVWAAMQTATDPAPLVPNGGSTRVEIDLKRQVLFLYEGGKLSKIFAVASGTADTPTPTGDYAIYAKSVGWETSPLGTLYNSQYFVGGYAIHGSRSVPSQPASHGCVRLTMGAADWFPPHVPIGTPVFVRG